MIKYFLGDNEDEYDIAYMYESVTSAKIELKRMAGLESGFKDCKIFSIEIKEVKA